MYKEVIENTSFILGIEDRVLETISFTIIKDSSHLFEYERGFMGFDIDGVLEVIIVEETIENTIKTIIHELVHVWQYFYAPEIYSDYNLSEGQAYRLQEDIFNLNYKYIL